MWPVECAVRRGNDHVGDLGSGTNVGEVAAGMVDNDTAARGLAEIVEELVGVDRAVVVVVVVAVVVGVVVVLCAADAVHFERLIVHVDFASSLTLGVLAFFPGVLIDLS